MTQAKKPTLAVELIVDDILQGVTPTSNAENLSNTSRRSVSVIEERIVFMTRYIVDAMLKKEKKRH